MKLDVVQIYQNYQQEIGITIPNFKERLIGATNYNGKEAADKIRRPRCAMRQNSLKLILGMFKMNINCKFVFFDYNPCYAIRFLSAFRYIEMKSHNHL